MGQVEAAQEALRAFGCDEALVALLTGLEPEVPVFVKSDKGSTEFVPVAAGPADVAALYCERRIFYVALDPERAQHFVALTQARIAEANSTTWRIAVPAHAAGVTALGRHFTEAIGEALLRSARSPGTSWEADTQRQRPARTCSVCSLERPASGICDDHGRQA